MYTSISTFRPALLCLLLLSGSAWAQTSAAQAGGFFADGSASTSASSAVTRVEDARQLPEDTYVTLEGYIIGSANSSIVFITSHCCSTTTFLASSSGLAYLDLEISYKFFI